MALSQLAVDYVNLTPSQKEYFDHLASGSDDTVLDYFEKVPPEVRGDSAAVEVYLNGGTAVVESPWGVTTYEVSDRDWSHDVSRHNGGSDSADNGRFEEASVNRARGADNTTVAEQQAADVASDVDAEVLSKADQLYAEAYANSSYAQDLDSTLDAAALGGATDLAAGSFIEGAVGGLLPVLGCAVAAKVVSDRFETTEDKVGYGALAALASAVYLSSPLGAPTVGAYVAYNLTRRGYELYKKHVAA